MDPNLRFVGHDSPVSGRLVSIRSARAEDGDQLQATETDVVESRAGRLGHAIHRLFVGAPLRSTALAEQRMSKLLALPNCP